MSWRTEPLGKLMTESRILCDSPHPNRRIRVKLNVAGVEKRPLENEIEGATKQFIRKAGQFIFGKQNFHKGAFGIIPKELDGFETSADIPSFDISDDCYAEWIFYYFKIGNRFKELEKVARGVGSKRIHPEQIADLEIPLPPKKVQKELLSKFNEIESQCSQIAAELNHQSGLVKRLRQAYLREAIQGKLIPQDPTDEPAEILLEKIEAEKEKLVVEKKIRRGKIQEPERQEVLFDIPTNWIWCLLDDICIYITDGTHQTPFYTSEGRIFLSAQNVKPFRFMPEVHRFVSEDAYQEYIKSRKAEKGDLLVARVGAGIGEAAVIDQDLDFAFYVSLGLVKPFQKYLSPKYIAIVLNSPFGVNYAKGNISSKGGSAGNFNLGRIRSFPFPLPPLAEQERIVAKLEKLMKFCDELESNIKQGITNADRLLQTALREALEPDG